MPDLSNEIHIDALATIVNDFLKVARLAGVEIAPNAIEIERSPSPHKPPTKLPGGKMAVYVFIKDGACLKVGKVGPKSHARFTSQHYNPTSSRSNLAKSAIAGQHKLGLADLSEQNVGDWIKANVDRANLILDAGYGIFVLSLLESFLQCRLNPMFEGFDSQR